jgi:hypothetical protein
MRRNQAIKGKHVILYGTIGAETCYVAVRRVWERTRSRPRVYTAAWSEKQFWYGQYKSDCPLELKRSHSGVGRHHQFLAWSGSSREVTGPVQCRVIRHMSHHIDSINSLIKQDRCGRSARCHSRYRQGFFSCTPHPNWVFFKARPAS